MSTRAAKSDATGSVTLPAAPTPVDGDQYVKVWDPFVRIFHWSLAGLFATAYLTAERYEDIHNGAGYAVAMLIGLRVIWGFVGSRHARFGDFVRSPREIASFLIATLRMKAPRHLGHNAAGGVMILALIVSLSLLCGSGILMASDALWGVEWVEDVHEAAADATLVLVMLHVAGVVVASIEHRENLIKSMITGWKRR